MNNSCLLFGVMSGTSIDGIDIVLTKIKSGNTKILDSLHIPYKSEMKKEILKLLTSFNGDLEASIGLSMLHAKITANGINIILKKNKLVPAKIKAIGYHGQTIRHNPSAKYSIQIGNAHLLSELTKITVISDFRNRDLVAGGQGAPLVPAFHNAMFSSKKINRIILNIGGISNITFLPTDGVIQGFDCGPGNILLDQWIKTNKDLDYDNLGRWAKSGKIIDVLFNKLMKEEFFQKLPPKSTGRELFNLKWIKKNIKKEYLPQDVQRTLLELTVATIALAINKFCSNAQEIYVCGGGSQNQFMFRRLTTFPNLSVYKTDKLGIPSQQVESLAFAWLADKTLKREFNNTPSVTGSIGPRILGTVHFS